MTSRASIGRWACSLLFLPLVARAGDGVWTVSGPTGGWFAQTVAFGSKGVYLGTGNAGVFAAASPPAGWVRSSGGLLVQNINALASSPSNPAVLYAGGPNGYQGQSLAGEVYRSTDGGNSWVKTTSTFYPLCLAVHPTNPSTVLACGIGTLHKTTDAGLTWTQTGGAGDASQVVYDTRNPSFVAAVAGQHPLRSTDGGDTWSYMTGGSWTLSQGPTLAIDTRSGGPLDVVYVNSGATLYKTTDGGSHFAEVTVAGCTLTGGLAFDAVSTPPALWFGACRSTDGGGTFTPRGGGLPASSPNTVWLKDAQTLFTLARAGTQYSVLWRTTDAGASWQDVTGAMIAQKVLTVGASPLAPSTAIVGYAGGFSTYRTTDGGLTFSTLPYLNISSSRIAIHPADPQKVWAASTAFGGLRKSTNGGTSWELPDLSSIYDVGYSPYRPLLLHPGDPSTVYLLGDGSTTPLRRSTNGGASFTNVSTNPGWGCNAAFATALAPSSPGVVVSLDHNGSLVSPNNTVWTGCVSGNGGETWTTVTGIPEYVEDLAIDPLVPTTFWAASDTQGLWRSTNAGASWARLLPSVASVARIALSPTNGAEVWAAEGTGGNDERAPRILRSTDAGATWVDSGFTGPRVWQLVHLGGSPARLYAATSGGLYALTGAPRFGDVNLDGVRDIFDVVALASLIVGNVAPGVAPFLGPRAYGDTNCDGTADVFDLVNLAAFVVGNVPSLPVCP